MFLVPARWLLSGGTGFSWLFFNIFTLSALSASVSLSSFCFRRFPSHKASPCSSEPRHDCQMDRWWLPWSTSQIRILAVTNWTRNNDYASHIPSKSLKVIDLKSFCDVENCVFASALLLHLPHQVSQVESSHISVRVSVKQCNPDSELAHTVRKLITATSMTPRFPGYPYNTHS